MIKKLLCLFTFVCTVFLADLYAQNFSLEMEQSGPQEIVIKFEQKGCEIKNVIVEGKEVYTLSLTGAGHSSNAGAPQLPVISRLLQVPPNATLTVEINEMQWDEDLVGIPAPAPAPLFRKDGEPEYFFDPDFYAGSNKYPQQLAEIGIQGNIRNLSVATLNIFPIQFDPAAGTLRILKNATIVVRASEPFSSQKINSRSFEAMLSDEILNPAPNFSSSKTSAYRAEQMLIITHDDFYNEILPYAEWKQKKGIHTKVIKTSEIGSFISNDEIRQTIQDAYDSPESLDYVILIGDYDKIPMNIGFALTMNDHQYATVAGSDYFPDIMIGRFSVNTAAECKLYVDKMLAYERHPQMLTPATYQQAAVVASNDGVDDMNGRHMVSVFQKYNFTKVDDLRESIATNTTANLSNALLDGRSWLFYIGHGYSTGWINVFPEFTNNTIAGLASLPQLPVVISIGCANADLDYSSGDCFGEKWMNNGVNSGAAAFIGATEDCAFFWTDTLGKYAVMGYLERKAPTLGAALIYGEMEMYDAFPQAAGGLTELTMQQHVLLGDPSHLPWTATPLPTQVAYPDKINSGDQTFTVSVNSNDTPVEDALVCISNQALGIWQSLPTDEAGKATFTIQNGKPGILDIVVTGYNLKPMESTIVVTPEDLKPADLVKIYPNPMITETNLELYSNLSASLTLFDAAGKLMLFDQNISTQYVLSRDNLSSGIYFYSIQLENGQKINGKLVIR